MLESEYYADMASYMSLERNGVMKAFALAHRLADNPNVGDKERKYFRAIAHLIWQAAGEDVPVKITDPDARSAVEILGDAAIVEASE